MPMRETAEGPDLGPLSGSSDESTPWMERRWLSSVTVIRTLVAVPTILLMGSFGGQLLIPVLIPLHLWSAKRSGPIGRVLWAIPAAASAAVFGWIVAYELVGESQPLIWLIPLVMSIGGGYALWRAAATPRSRRENELLRVRFSRLIANRSTRPAAALAVALSVANTVLIHSIGILPIPFVWMLVGGVVLVELCRARQARDGLALALGGFALACPWLVFSLWALAARNLG